MSENTSKDCDLQKQIDELQQKLSQLETDFERKSRNPWGVMARLREENMKNYPEMYAYVPPPVPQKNTRLLPKYAPVITIAICLACLVSFILILFISFR